MPTAHPTTAASTAGEPTSNQAQQQLAAAEDSYRRLSQARSAAAGRSADIWRQLLKLSRNYDPADPAGRQRKDQLLAAFRDSRIRLRVAEAEAERAWQRVLESRKALSPQVEIPRVAKAKAAYQRAVEANNSAQSELATAKAEREKTGHRIAGLEVQLSRLRDKIEQIFDDSDSDPDGAQQLAEPLWDEIVEIRAELTRLKPLMEAAYARENRAEAEAKRASRARARAGDRQWKAGRPGRGLTRIWRLLADLRSPPSN